MFNFKKVLRTTNKKISLPLITAEEALNYINDNNK